jgi:hypothetical protein
MMGMTMTDALDWSFCSLMQSFANLNAHTAWGKGCGGIATAVTSRFTLLCPAACASTLFGCHRLHVGDISDEPFWATFARSHTGTTRRPQTISTQSSPLLQRHCILPVFRLAVMLGRFVEGVEELEVVPQADPRVVLLHKTFDGGVRAVPVVCCSSACLIAPVPTYRGLETANPAVCLPSLL